METFEGMKRSSHRSVVLLVAGSLLWGCAEPKTLYFWGQYERQVYLTYSKPDKATVQEQVQKILVQPLEKASVFLASGVRIFDTNGSAVRIPKQAPPTSPSAPPPPTPAQQLAMDALSAAPAGLALYELPRRVTIATMRVLLRRGQAAFVDDRWTLATAGVTIPPAGLNPSPGSLP